MYTILVQDDNTLQTSIRTRIMQNSKNIDYLHFLVKPNYNEIDMTDLTVVLTYILPISKERKTLTLTKSEELYKERLEYKILLDDDENLITLLCFFDEYDMMCIEGDDGDEEIFCDDASRAAMMGRVFKGRLLPLVVLFTLCLLPQFIVNLVHLQNYGIAIFIGFVMGLYLGCFAVFGIKYAKYKNKTKK